MNIVSNFAPIDIENEIKESEQAEYQNKCSKTWISLSFILFI
jgi:hypothetical protein